MVFWVGMVYQYFFFPLTSRIDFSSMCDMAYNRFGVSSQLFNLKLFLWYSFDGNVVHSEIVDDNTFETVYILNAMNAQYQAQFEVKFVPVVQPTQSSFMEQLRNVQNVHSQQLEQSQDLFPSSFTEQFHHAGYDEDDHQAEDHQIQGDEQEHNTTGGFEYTSEDEGSNQSYDTVDRYSVLGEVSEDEGRHDMEEHEEIGEQIVERIAGFVNDQEYFYNHLPFDENKEQLDY